MKTEELKAILERHVEEEEKNLSTLNEKIDKMMGNHLAHIQIDITRLEERMKLVLWLIGSIGGAILITLVGAILTLILK